MMPENGLIELQADQHRRRCPLLGSVKSVTACPPRARLKACRQSSGPVIPPSSSRESEGGLSGLLRCQRFGPRLALGEGSRIRLSFWHILRPLRRAYIRPFRFSADPPLSGCRLNRRHLPGL